MWERSWEEVKWAREAKRGSSGDAILLAVKCLPTQVHAGTKAEDY